MIKVQQMEKYQRLGKPQNEKDYMLLNKIGAPGGIRTPDLKVRSLAFYPAKLQAQIFYLSIIL